MKNQNLKILSAVLISFFLVQTNHVTAQKSIAFQKKYEVVSDEVKNLDNWTIESSSKQNIFARFRIEEGSLTIPGIDKRPSKSSMDKSTISNSPEFASFTHPKFALSRNEALKIQFTSSLNGLKKDNTFSIGLIAGNDSILFHLVDRDFTVVADGENYLVALDDSEKEQSCQLTIEKKNNSTYGWGFASGNNSFYGEFESKQIKEPEYGGFFIPVTYSREIKISAFSIGAVHAKFYKNATEAIHLPHEAECPTVYLKYDGLEIKGVEHLKLNGIKGEVTKEELDRLNEYLIARPLLTKNYQNTLFASWSKAYMMEWVYEVKKDIRMVNRLIEQAESIQKYRDDNYLKYRTRLSADKAIYTKGWSHFRGICYQDGLPTKMSLGIATLGTGINYPAAAAKAIAAHPEIWGKRYQGQTYKEIALSMLNLVNESWDFAIEHYYDEKTNLLLSPSYGSEPEAYVPQWNRIFPLMTAGNTLVDAYELLGVKNAKADKIDSILKSVITHFWENTRTETVNEKDVLLFPYGVYRWKLEKNHTEDGGHFGFDLRGFRVFHESGRYWTEEQSRLLANVMNENVVLDDKGSFSKRLNGGGVTKGYDYWGALPPMIWLAEFEPKLENKLVKYIHNVMDGRETLDGRVVFHTLHLRAEKYGFEE